MPIVCIPILKTSRHNNNNIFNTVYLQETDIAKQEVGQFLIYSENF